MTDTHPPPGRPRIVVLDGYTLTPATPDHAPEGEPSWDRLAGLGDLAVHARTAAADLVDAAAGAPIVLTNKAPLRRETIQALPELKYIGVLATGVNVVDLDAASERGVVVTNVPAYSTDSVAQHVFALLLELAVRTGEHDRSVHAGDWARGPDFAYTVAPTIELAGKTLGVVGMGAIGRAVGRIGHALGMNILAHSRTRYDLDFPAEWVEVDRLFAESDAVTLHCPLTDATKHLVNRNRLEAMKPSAYLLNTGRGPLLDEAAVAEALRENRIAGVGVDVLSTEPPRRDNPLLDAPRCVITPHIAWATREARRRLMDIAVDNVRGYLAGQTQNKVNP